MEVSDMDLRLPYYMMYPIPYAFDEDKIQKRDREYLQSMYPATAKKIFPYIQEECDRQEYEGSMIYDEYPEQIREIVEILMYQELIERRGKGRRQQEKTVASCTGLVL